MGEWIRSEHVSRWPSHDLPDKDEFRLIGIWREDVNCVVLHETGEVIRYVTREQFIKEITDRRLYVLCHRLSDFKSFKHLEELLADRRVKAYGVTRTGGFFGLYIKSRRSAWIIERRVWDESPEPPDKEFCETLQSVWRANNRCASTPGALGERKIIETLARGTRFSRPNVPLRNRLLQNKTGGRADTIEEKKHYGALYEEDINSAHIAAATTTIDPSEHPTRFGLRSGGICDRSFLQRFFSFYAACEISIPTDCKDITIGPIHSRSTGKRLIYPTAGGTKFTGWYWMEEIDRSIHAGYHVAIRHGYGWYRSSNWLEQWANTMYDLRVKYKGQPAIADIIKKEMVAAIGRMGMAPERLSLVHESEYIDGDIPVCIRDARAHESPVTKWFIHVDPEMDSNRLTHISSYIVAMTRVALYDRMLEEEKEQQCSIVASNFDSYYMRRQTKLETGQGLGQWKERKITNAYIYGPRSIKGLREGVPIDKRPGIPKKKRGDVLLS